MEVSCPQCKQRLRYSDDLRNPLLRCRTCSTTFRPHGLTADIVEEPVAAVAVDEHLEFGNPSYGSRDASLPKIDPGPVTASRGNKSRFGYGAIILFIVLFKVAPRLAREFFRDPKPPQPAQLQQDEQQAIQRMLQEAAENAENARRQPQIQPMPAPEVGGPFDATE